MAREKEFSLQTFSFAKLQSLLTFAEATSMTAAANKQGRQAGSLSRHIKALEEFFGCNLREKSGKTTRLSSQGQELVTLLRQQVKVLQDFRDRCTKHLGSVRIAAGDSLLHLSLFPKLSELQSVFSETTLHVSALPTFQIIQGLQNYTIELGILRKAPLAKRRSRKNAEADVLDFVELGQYQYAVFVPRDLVGGSDVAEADVF